MDEAPLMNFINNALMYSQFKLHYLSTIHFIND